MNVMYTCDNNFVWLMEISVISLFENSKNIENLKVYLLGEKVSQENKEELRRVSEKYKRRIEIIDVPEITIPPSLVSSRWPLSAYTRLFSGQILPPNVDKILYLDCDTIISGDISELDEIEFDGNIAYAVKDCVSGSYKKNIGLDKNAPYFNAGVILFDINELREIDVNKKIEEYMKKYMELINYADQDIFNGIFDGKIGELSPKFDFMTINAVHTYEEVQTLRHPTNFYSKEEFDIAKKNPVIIHYTTNMLVIRPWFSNTNHPLKDEFKKYMDMSIWKNKKVDAMKFKSKEAKVIKMIMKLPQSVAYCILGVIHAELKPAYIKMRCRR